MATIEQLKAGLARAQALPDSDTTKATAIAKIEAALANSGPAPTADGKPGVLETIYRALPHPPPEKPGTGAGAVEDQIRREVNPALNEADQIAARTADIAANEKRNAAAATANPIAHGVTKFAAGVAPMLIAGPLGAAGRMIVGGASSGVLSGGDPIDTAAGALSGGLPFLGGLKNVVKGGLGGAGLALGAHEAHSLQDKGELSMPPMLDLILGGAGGAAQPLISQARFGSPRAELPGSGTKELPTGGIRSPDAQRGRNIEAIESEGGKLNVLTAHSPGNLPPISTTRGAVGAIPGSEGAPRIPLAPNSVEAFGESNKQLTKSVIHSLDKTDIAGQKALAATENLAMSRYPDKLNSAAGIVDGFDGLIADMSVGDPASPFNAQGNRLKSIRDKLVTKQTMPDGSVREEPRMISLKEEIALRRQLDNDAKVGAPTARGGTGIGDVALRKAAGIVRDNLAKNAPPELQQAFAQRHAELSMQESINDRLMGMDDPTVDWNSPREVRLASRFDKYGAEVGGSSSAGREMTGTENTESALRDLDALAKKVSKPESRVESHGVEGLRMSRAHRALAETKMALPNFFYRNTGPGTSVPLKGFIDPLLSHIDPALEYASMIQPLPLILGAEKRREKRP